MAATLARASFPAALRSLASRSRRHSAAGAALCRFDAAGSAKKETSGGSLVNFRHTVTSAGGGRALQAEAAAAVPLRSVPVRVAYELQQAGHRYLDVRTESEFSAGHPERAVNIPYLFRAGSGRMGMSARASNGARMGHVPLEAKFSCPCRFSSCDHRHDHEGNLSVY
ncbi:uncharacterized protein [Miscanthus floridulus]|uniref:uncharacterized protein isoform X3 n=1 Tax=Miscanthus floridulus TaxID=154761 RepID=UPI0034580C5E